MPATNTLFHHYGPQVLTFLLGVYVRGVGSGSGNVATDGDSHIKIYTLSVSPYIVALRSQS